MDRPLPTWALQAREYRTGSASQVRAGHRLDRALHDRGYVRGIAARDLGIGVVEAADVGSTPDRKFRDARRAVLRDAAGDGRRRCGIENAASERRPITQR